MLYAIAMGQIISLFHISVWTERRAVQSNIIIIIIIINEND